MYMYIISLFHTLHLIQMKEILKKNCIINVITLATILLLGPNLAGFSRHEDKLGHQRTVDAVGGANLTGLWEITKFSTNYFSLCFCLVLYFTQELVIIVCMQWF